MSGQSDNRYGDRDDKPLTGVATPVSETKASLTIQTALKLEAKPLGIIGNYITVRAVSSGVTGMSISNLTGTGTQADPYLIEIKLGTTVTNNTMTLIAAAIAAKTDVAAIVNAVVITGATQMTAFAVQSLSGGLNGTAGFRNQEVIDINDTSWTMCHTDGSVYYWGITDKDVYPALDTEYVSHYCKRLSKVVYKMAKETTTSANGTVLNTAHGIIGFSKIYSPADVFIINSVGNNIGNYYVSGTDYFIGYINQTNCVTVTPNAIALNSRPCYFKFKYIKV